RRRAASRWGSRPGPAAPGTARAAAPWTVRRRAAAARPRNRRDRSRRLAPRGRGTTRGQLGLDVGPRHARAHEPGEQVEHEVGGLGGGPLPVDRLPAQLEADLEGPSMIL